MSAKDVKFHEHARTKIVAGVNILAVSASSIELGWTDASPDESGFQIQRRAQPSGSPWQAWLTVGTAGANATGYALP